MRHVEIMWSAVCSLVPHSHFTKEARPHLYMDEPKHPMSVCWQLSLTQAVLVLSHSNRPCTDVKNAVTWGNVQLTGSSSITQCLAQM